MSADCDRSRASGRPDWFTTALRREAGQPKYTFSALILLAIDGLISFSSYPLRLVTYLGIVTIGVAVALLVWVLSDAFYHRTAPQGWASTLVTVLFMGSIQLFSLGIIGEYIRLIFLETKGAQPTSFATTAGRRTTVPKSKRRIVRREPPSRDRTLV